VKKNRKSVKIRQNYGHDFVVSLSWPTVYNNKNQCHNCKQHESSAPTRRTGLSLWGVHKSRTAKVMLSADKTQIETTQSACYISPMSLQHNTSYTMFDWTFLEVFLNGHLTFELSITQTTGKLFVFWMYWMMLSQFTCCIETLWTFTANIRLHSFMSLNMFLQNTIAAEFLLTNVTREPSTFIVWLQQMCLELMMPCKTVWTVSTW